MHLTSKEIEAYCVDHTSPLPEVFSRLRDETYATLYMPQMQVGTLEGSFLKMLVAITGARRVLEFGTYSGFSALAMAQALPEDGELITCEIDERKVEFTAPFWDSDPHGKKIRLEIGPGVETLEKLKGQFDLVFIDADKANYQNYWDGALPLLKKGGLLVVDNVLWSGKVLDPKEASDHQIHAFNEYARQDKRVEIVMLPVRDGLLLARKL
jgi:caffeoyl-CoA O-methyltransferase